MEKVEELYLTLNKFVDAKKHQEEKKKADKHATEKAKKDLEEGHVSPTDPQFQGNKAYQDLYMKTFAREKVMREREQGDTTPVLQQLQQEDAFKNYYATYRE